MGRYPLGETWDNACRLQLDGMPEKARAPRPRGPAPRGAASVRGASVCAVFTRFGLVLGLTCMAPSARAHAPDFSAAEEGWQGLSEFVELARRSAGPERLKVVAQVDYEALTPDDALVVLYPEVELDARSLTAFLAAGGRLALFDDFGRATSFLRTFGIQRVPAPPDARFSLRGDPDLAIATPYEETVAGARIGRHPMLDGIDQVVTNHPQALEHPDLTPLLGIEKNDGALVPVLVTGVIAGKGRLVAGSDPSIFINLMLRYPGNRRLASSLVQYLTARDAATGPGGASGSKGRVFVATGRFEQVGAYGAEDAGLPWRREFERWREKARDAFAQGVPDVVWLLGAALLAVLVVGRELVRLRLRGPFEQPTYARAVPVLAQAGAWARAEVLAAPTTTPLLALVELESALSETLEHRLGLSTAQTAPSLREALTARGLDPSSARRMAELLGQLRELSRTLATRNPKRPSGAQLKRLEVEGTRLLEALERLGGKG